MMCVFSNGAVTTMKQNNALTAKQLRAVLRRKCWMEDEYHDFEKEGWYVTIRLDSKICVQAYGRKEEEKFSSGWHYVEDCRVIGSTLHISGVEVHL